MNDCAIAVVYPLIEIETENVLVIAVSHRHRAKWSYRRRLDDAGYERDHFFVEWLLGGTRLNEAEIAAFHEMRRLGQAWAEKHRKSMDEPAQSVQA